MESQRTPTSHLAGIATVLLMLFTSFSTLAHDNAIAEETETAYLATDERTDEEAGVERGGNREDEAVATKSPSNPKFKCRPVHKVYGTTTSPPTPQVDLICPSGHFLTTASCSQQGSPILNTPNTPLLPPLQSWANYLILNGNGFARGVHCRVFTGKAIAQAMCCANY